VTHFGAWWSRSLWRPARRSPRPGADRLSCSGARRAPDHCG